MTTTLERRRHHRVHLSLTLEYAIQLPDADEIVQGHGILKDISLSGTYFHADPASPFQLGQTLSIIIPIPLPYLDISEISHLRALGRVVRIDPAASGNSRPGFALSFLEGLTFCTSATWES